MNTGQVAVLGNAKKKVKLQSNGTIHPDVMYVIRSEDNGEPRSVADTEGQAIRQGYFFGQTETDEIMEIAEYKLVTIRKRKVGLIDV